MNHHQTTRPLFRGATMSTEQVPYRPLFRGLTDMSIRSDGRTVEGICVPWDEPANVADHEGVYAESWQRGSFAKTLERGAGRVKVYVNHKHQVDPYTPPVGRALDLREDAVGLFGSFRVSATPDGDHALELVRDGVLDALSVGAAPVNGKTVWRGARSSRSPFGTEAVRTEARLIEVSLVAHPAFESAMISSVRTEGSQPGAEAAPHFVDDYELELVRLRLHGYQSDERS